MATLIPKSMAARGLDYGGLRDLEEIHRSGAKRLPATRRCYHGHSVAPRIGSAQAQYLPKIADGSIRLQASRERTQHRHGHHAPENHGRRNGDRYVITVKKFGFSRAEHSDLMLLIARTTPRIR